MRLISPDNWQLQLEKLDWEDWVPSVTAATGSFTSVANGGNRYCQVGNIVFYQTNISITNQGTAAGDVRLSLPIAAVSGEWQYGSGRETDVVGQYLTSGIISSTLIIQRYDNVFPGLTGRRLVCGGFYEIS